MGFGNTENSESRIQESGARRQRTEDREVRSKMRDAGCKSIEHRAESQKLEVEGRRSEVRRSSKLMAQSSKEGQRIISNCEFGIWKYREFRIQNSGVRSQKAEDRGQRGRIQDAGCRMQETVVITV